MKGSVVRPLVLALLLGGLAAQDPPSAPPRAGDGPGPRVRLAGQHSVHALSRIRFADAPDEPHLLATTLGFPSRVRTALSREGGRASERSVAYRYGDALWSLAPDSEESRPVPDAEREFVTFEFALRRALLLWPHGHEWSPLEPGAAGESEGGTRRATLALPDGPATLVASGVEDETPDAPPRRLALLDRQGGERLRYDALTWTREDDRWRPRTLRFVIGDVPVWTEEVRLVDRRARFADFWFVPPDRRESPGGSTHGTVRTLDLRPGLVYREELERTLDLGGALESARRLVADAVAPPGHRLATDLRVELDAAGVPRAVSVWMEPWSEAPPPGWSAVSGGPALAIWLDGPESLRAETIAALLRQAGEAAGTDPRFLLQVDAGDGVTRLVLPLPGEAR